MEFLEQLFFTINENPQMANLFNICWILILSLSVFYVTRAYLIRGVLKVLAKAQPRLRENLLKSRTLVRLSYLAPAIIIYNFAYLLPGPVNLIKQIISALIILFLMLVIGSILNLINQYYSQLEISRDLPIKSYLQILKIIIYVLGGLVMIAVLFDKSPLVFLSGIGALTAVLLLIFKDTILSLVASIQINSNDLVNVGDWIEVPSFGADGDVIDIALHQIQVQNWDKTITTIPTYKLLDATFKNWRGMTVSGGRRIKRTLFIDVNSVRFLTDQEIARFKSFTVLENYVNQKTKELREFNTSSGERMEELVNGRHMTNLGTFRTYIEEYLKNHPSINQNMTLMARQLQLTSQGVPLQIYCFTKTVEWVEYENIQSDIFDHILAVINEFGLVAFQEPMGTDFTKLTANSELAK